MNDNKKIKFYKIGKKVEDIKEITVEELEFELELMQKYDMDIFRNELKEYVNAEKQYVKVLK